MDLEALLSDLVIVDDPGKIRLTAETLEGLKYTPILLNHVPDFLRITSAAFFPALEKVLQEPDAPEAELPAGETALSFREKKASLMIYHYKLLNRLRRGEPEAWDEINGLMEDD